jgi:hypothetical protein
VLYFFFPSQSLVCPLKWISLRCFISVLLICCSARSADNTADSLCNIYVLISDTRFRRIKGLARIHHHHLSITLGIAHHPFSLLLSSLDLREFYCLFMGSTIG